MAPRGDTEGLHFALSGRAKLQAIPNDGISDLLPWSAFIFTVCAIFIAGTCYLSEKFLLESIYGYSYRKLVNATRIDGHERRRRGFVSHHLALAFKTLLLCVCADPALRLFLPGPDNFYTPLRGEGQGPTIGDMLLVAGQLYCAYYTWELCYRASLASYISILHHVVLLIVAQFGMGSSTHYGKFNESATIMFYMCLVWGAFDIASELPVHLGMILYRTMSPGRRRMVFEFLFFCTAWCLCCTVVEMAITAYLLWSSWSEWAWSSRIATPIVLLVWGIAQCISSWQVFGIAMAERKKVVKRENDVGRVTSIWVQR